MLFTSLNSNLDGSSGVVAGSGVTLHNVYLHKIGKIVIFRCRIEIADSVAGNTYELATMPSGYAPAEGEILFTVWAKYNSASEYSYATLGILNSGKLRTRTGSGSFRGETVVNVVYIGT